MLHKKILGIPFAYPFFETYKEVLHKTDPSFFHSALFFVPYKGFKNVLIDFFKTFYPLEIVQTLRVCTLNETEDWMIFVDQNTPQFLSPLKPLKRRHLMVDLLLSLKQEFLPVSTPLNTWIKIAEEILTFLDDVYQTQQEDHIFNQLEQFFTSHLAHHWGITIEYLQQVIKKWPLLLHDLNYTEPLLYRRFALHHLLKTWGLSPPTFPVIILGIPEATPAVKMLLKAVFHLEKGQIVLPYDAAGHLGVNLDTPLYTCSNIFEFLQCGTSDIQVFTPTTCSKSPLVPWMLTTSTPVQDALTLQEHSGLVQEVQFIGSTLKHYYETSDKRVAVIIPPGDLSYCIRIFLKKLNIPFTSSSAIPLRKTILAQLSWLSLSIALAPRNQTHLYAFWNFCQPFATEKRPFTAEEAIRLGELALPLQKAFAQFSFQTVVKGHRQVLLSLFTYCTQQPPSTVWETAFQMFEGYELLTDIFENIMSLSLPVQYPYEYEIILEQAFQTVLPCQSLFKERILILKPFESLFVPFDVAIIGDFNEGTWPLQKRDDVWLTPLLRKEWNLPDTQTNIGIEMQYFLHSCSAPEIILSRSLKNYGQATLASRWLLQLQIALKKEHLERTQLFPRLCKIDRDILKSFTAVFDKIPETLFKKMSWNQTSVYSVPDYHPCLPPQPCPPVSARPRQLSVTAIEQWMRDPYAIYARYILKLKPLDTEQQSFAAQRGSIIHHTIDQWFKTVPLLTNTEQENRDAFLVIAKNIIADLPPAATITATIWWPRFYHIATWLVQKMHILKTQIQASYSEIKGKIVLEPLAFTLTAEADRLEWRQNSETQGWVIIDYKTGTLPSVTDIHSGFSPQLPLEALICHKRGFPILNHFPAYVKDIEYWHLTGDIMKPGKILSLSASLPDLLKQTEEGLESLIRLFDNPKTPYLSCPRPDKAPTWRVYDHLARRQEWS